MPDPSPDGRDVEGGEVEGGEVNGSPLESRGAQARMRQRLPASRTFMRASQCLDAAARAATTLSLALILLPRAQAAPIGLTPELTHALVQAQADALLFIDVRDPVEIMFVGSTDEVDTNIPFVQVNRRVWDQENNRFQLEPNPQFAQQVQQALEAKGLTRDAMVITMCRSGSERGEPSALFLQEQGFPNARYVLNGFQGDRLSEGSQAGMRLKNGWQNSGLPWLPQMNPDKIYRTDR